MTRTMNARLAGSMFLFYIGTGVASMLLFSQATGRAYDTSQTLAAIAHHPTIIRITALLSLLTFVDAVVLAVALYAPVREVDRDLALLALCCRVTEGVIAAVSAMRTMGLLSVATTSLTASPVDAPAVNALGALLLQAGGLGTLISATCFALGSTLYSYLFLRARSIPVVMAWLGVVASAILVIGLPVQLAGFLHAPLTAWMWIPMAIFEITFVLWLLIKGVASPPRSTSAAAH